MSFISRTAHRLPRSVRHERNAHTGGVIWLTGLSGSGKSTLAMRLEQLAFERGWQAYTLDGDNLRHGLNGDLDFSPAGRSENVRRTGEVAALFADAGLIAIAALISPYRADRARARSAAGKNFHEVYVKASLEVCEQRDPKGLYKKARAGELSDFTGVSSAYEPPLTPELLLDTGADSVDQSVERLFSYVKSVFALRAEYVSAREAP